MYMKTVLLILKNRLSEKYPDVTIEFYVSRSSTFLHMGLDILFYTCAQYFEMIAFIESFWKEKIQDDKFDFVNPYLIKSEK